MKNLFFIFFKKGHYHSIQTLSN